MAFDINAASQFLRGYLGEQERSANEKKIQKLIDTEKYDISYTQDPTTGKAVPTLKTKKKVTPQDTLAQQKTITQQRENELRASIQSRGGPRTPGEEKLVYGLQPSLYNFLPQVGGSGGLRNTPPPTTTGKTIQVKRKSDGQVGTVLEKDFNSNTYTRL